MTIQNTNNLFIQRRTTQMLRDDPLMAINTALLHSLDKRLTYAWLYSRDDMLQERIDEEGCGAFFAAFRG